jgi:hypothetical protein
MNDKKVNKVMLDCYREIYLNSTPSADFDQLVAGAKLNEFGQKVIDFNDYVIEEKKFDEITSTIIKKNRIKEPYKRMIRNSILLGCSPKFKK